MAKTPKTPSVEKTASSKKIGKFVLGNAAQIEASLNKAWAQLVRGEKRGAKTEFSHATDNYVYWDGEEKQFIHPVAFVRKCFDVIEQGFLPIERNLLQVSYESFRRTYPPKDYPELWNTVFQGPFDIGTWGSSAGKLANSLLSARGKYLNQTFENKLNLFLSSPIPKNKDPANPTPLGNKKLLTKGKLSITRTPIRSTVSNDDLYDTLADILSNDPKVTLEEFHYANYAVLYAPKTLEQGDYEILYIIYGIGARQEDGKLKLVPKTKKVLQQQLASSFGEDITSPQVERTYEFLSYISPKKVDKHFNLQKSYDYNAPDETVISGKIHQAHPYADAIINVRNSLQTVRDIDETGLTQQAIDIKEHMLRELTEIYNKMLNVEKVIPMPELNDVNEFNAYVKTIAKEQLDKLGVHQAIIVFRDKGTGNLTSRTATFNFDIMATVNFVTLQGASQQWLGGTLGQLKQQFEEKYREILKHFGAQEVLVKDMAATELSSSYLTILVLQALDTIYNTKDFSKLIKKKSGNKVIKTIRMGIKPGLRRKTFKKLNLLVKKHKDTINKTLKYFKSLERKKARSTGPALSTSSARQQTRIRQRTRNIVPILNRHIKRYVISGMSEKTLRYQSGDFANSVKVLSAHENRAVEYTYQRRPYEIFSKKDGKPPWNTIRRNPANIINRAIVRIGIDKLNRVLKVKREE
jgi:hypothetical protein